MSKTRSAGRRRLICLQRLSSYLCPDCYDALVQPSRLSYFQPLLSFTIFTRGCTRPILSSTPITGASSSACVSSHTLIDALTQPTILRHPKSQLDILTPLLHLYFVYIFTLVASFVVSFIPGCSNLTIASIVSTHVLSARDSTGFMVPTLSCPFILIPCFFRCQLRTRHLHT